MTIYIDTWIFHARLLPTCVYFAGKASQANVLLLVNEPDRMPLSSAGRLKIDTVEDKANL